ncbi:hypothetical protein KDK_52870 [Dictyobacter kobayashii]|uniref:Uncharacterized protein n=1 Tax=Dictyobacter kobayashii TaxID=2014872 RepID=A0A402AQW7_9CHLR|nr:hypothetical protein KDK_52870 [Dictyobacter kobayashii]
MVRQSKISAEIITVRLFLNITPSFYIIEDEIAWQRVPGVDEIAKL